MLSRLPLTFWIFQKGAPEILKNSQKKVSWNHRNFLLNHSKMFLIVFSQTKTAWKQFRIIRNTPNPKSTAQKHFLMCTFFQSPKLTQRVGRWLVQVILLWECFAPCHLQHHSTSSLSSPWSFRSNVSRLPLTFRFFKNAPQKISKKSQEKSLLQSFKLLAQSLQSVSHSVESNQNYLETVPNHPKHTRSEIYSSKTFSIVWIFSKPKIDPKGR